MKCEQALVTYHAQSSGVGPGRAGSCRGPPQSDSPLKRGADGLAEPFSVGRQSFRFASPERDHFFHRRYKDFSSPSGFYLAILFYGLNDLLEHSSVLTVSSILSSFSTSTIKVRPRYNSLWPFCIPYSSTLLILIRCTPISVNACFTFPIVDG